jgi:hypothetical protein
METDMPDINILLTGVSLVGLIAIGAWVCAFILYFNQICRRVEALDDSREYIWDRIDDVREEIKKLQDAVDGINAFLDVVSSPPGKNVKPSK